MTSMGVMRIKVRNVEVGKGKNVKGGEGDARDEDDDGMRTC